MERYPYEKSIKNENGDWRKVYASTPEELAQKVKARKRQVEYLKALQANPTVAVYANTWMDMRPSDLSASRLADYDLALRQHILPYIGDKHIMEVTTQDIADMMHAQDGDAKNPQVKANAKLSRSMQQKVVYVLKGIFAQAVTDGYIKNDPTETLKPGGKTTEQKDALTHPQREQLEATIRDTRVYPFVMLGLYAGLRREEILGLKWDAVHLTGKAPYIEVVRSLKWEGGHPVLSNELKSSAAKRNVPIPDNLVAVLRALQASQAPGTAYVITDTRGRLMSQQAYTNLWALVQRRQTDAYRPHRKSRTRFKPGEKKNHRGERPSVPHVLDFAVTPHTLRRTYASELILAGVNLKKAQYLLGHKKAETTLNWYAKLMDNRPEDLIGDVRATFKTPDNTVAALRSGRYRVKKITSKITCPPLSTRYLTPKKTGNED